MRDHVNRPVPTGDPVAELHPRETGLAELHPRETGLGNRVSGRITEELQLAILTGCIPEGSRLPAERVLVQRYDVSRSSVQAAIHSLELQGLVTIRRGSQGGAYVTKPDVTHVAGLLQTAFLANGLSTAELHGARELLEPGLAASAARCADAKDIAMLRAAVRADDFHQHLARVTGNPVFEFLIGTLLVPCATPPSLAPSVADARTTDHERIVDAIAAGDETAARDAMAAHLIGRSKRGLIDQRPFRRGSLSMGSNGTA